MVYQAHSQYCVRGRSDDIVVRSDERKFSRYIGQLTSDFIGPQIFNFERSLNLSPGPKKHSCFALHNFSWRPCLWWVYNCILNSLEKKEISCFVFCDFSKAFDKVWHKGLIHKIKSYGVDSNLLNWFSSYLQDRQQRVLINNSSSSLCNVSAGVPQDQY